MAGYRKEAPKASKILTLIGAGVLLAGGGVATKLLVFPDTGSVPSGRVAASAKASPDPSSPPATPEPENPATPKPEKTVPSVSFTVAATGDFLTHARVIRAAREPGGRYSLTKLLEPLRPWIQGADLALCHQEIVYGAPGEAPRDFPNFLMPNEMAAQLAELGYDGCSTASNHTWDSGQAGALRTLDTLRAAGLGTAGSRKSAEETPWQMYEITKGGRTIKVAHLSLAYGLNQGNVSYVADHPWAVEIGDPEKTILYARDARAAGADVVIVSGHTGIEYQFAPSVEQRKWTQLFAKSGMVDLYIGHHAHVSQAITKLPGGPNGRGMWVYYGLGNVMSAQLPSQSIGTQIEEIAWADITVPGERNEPVKVEARYVPLVLDRSNSLAYPMQLFLTGSRPPGAGIATATVQSYYQTFKEVVGNEAAELLPAEGIPSGADSGGGGGSSRADSAGSSSGSPATVTPLPRGA